MILWQFLHKVLYYQNTYNFNYYNKVSKLNFKHLFINDRDGDFVGLATIFDFILAVDGAFLFIKTIILT